MAVEDADDLAIFFDADDFGVVATITPSSGDPFDVAGIFDRPTIERGVQHDNQFNRNSQGVVGQVPTFRAPTAALAGVSEGATLTINGETWRAHAMKPDGLGTTRIDLKKVVP